MALRDLALLLLGAILGAVLTVTFVADRQSPAPASKQASRRAESPEPEAPDPELMTAGSPGAVSTPEPDPQPKAAERPPPVPAKRGVVMRADAVPEAPPDAVAVESMLPPELKRARDLDKQYDLFGDRAKYGYRIQLYDSRGYAFARSGLKRQPGRTVPDAWVPFVLKVAGIEATKEELAEYVDRGWKLWEDESRLIGALAKRTQEIIDQRARSGKVDENVAAIEVRDGKVYVVRSSDDIEVRTLMETLRGLEEQRRGFARRIAEER